MEQGFLQGPDTEGIVVLVKSLMVADDAVLAEVYIYGADPPHPP